ncbi:hypothetical protein OZN62_09960 [Aurantiacibacter sp. MUD11]|uniref:hypothetical protein n=1 Tax=Aurantiacibacter sp. MUD11 TaxID=3003265 RepID=UPI0022AA3B6C|nr:hypothetical protein [Aurantiacibacter sp. MUD11]WAT17253.1 hypothetical protein OZN62_09960 [Aurantiacibacter sp. MUD11]
MVIRNFALAAAASATALGTAPAVAQDAEAQVFQPTGTWTADFGEDYCRLLRTYSDGNDQLTVAFERIQPGPFMRMLIIGDSFRTFRGAERIGYGFDPLGTNASSDLATSQTGDGQRLSILGTVSLNDQPKFNRVFQAREGAEEASPEPEAVEDTPQFPGYDPAAELERAGQVTSMTFDEGMRRDLRIETGNLAPAMEVMQNCAKDLLRVWGIDPERHQNLSRGAFPTQGRLISNRTVPFDQFARLTGNYNQVRIMIDAEGAATSCHIHFPTLEANVNERICDQVMENASFYPALDADGQPTASYWLVPVFVLFGPPGS